MNIINFHAGLGGNALHWDENEHEIIHVENHPKIASVLQRMKPNQKVVVADAKEYLLANYEWADFIWMSPPCQTHSKMNKATRHKSCIRFVDGQLFEFIIFLTHHFKGLFTLENVVPYYEIYGNPTRMGRHLFWSNFPLTPIEVKQPKGFINLATTDAKKVMMDWLGIHYDENIYYGKNHCPVQILRNCVHPLVGQSILNDAMTFLNGKSEVLQTNQASLF